MFRPIQLLWAGLLAALTGCSEPLDRVLNPVKPGTPPTFVSAQDRSFHWSLFVADLHADTLGSNRDFFATGQTAGHVDLPRLQEGNVRLQVFTVYTNTPNARSNGCVDGYDTNLAAVQQPFEGRPLPTWFSDKERALYEARRLHQLSQEAFTRAAATPGAPEMMLIETAGDVAKLIARNRHGETVIGALLGLEGAHAFEGDVKNVGVFYDQGFRLVAPTHRFHNALSGSSEGCGEPYGLTEYGREVITAAAGRRMLIDVAHAASLSIQEVSALAVAGGFPIVSSHGGVVETCPRKKDATVARNISDDDIRAIARTGGVIGIGFWPEAVCWEPSDSQAQRLDSIVRAMAHVRTALEQPDFVAEMRARDPNYDPINHIAFGSDFDGAVEVPFDASGMSLLTAAMRHYQADGQQPFDDRAIRKIAGANVCRVLATQLPGGSSEFARTTCDPLLVDPGLRAEATSSPQGIPQTDQKGL